MASTKTLTVDPILRNMDGGAERWMIGVMPPQKLNLETTNCRFRTPCTNRSTEHEGRDC